SKRTSLYLQKVSDIHLYSHLDDELEVNGNINNVYMMGVIGLFIILIAGFNFINLSTARATKRAKEVGLRKVVGAIRGQLITQYLSESVLITLLAMVLSLAFAFMGLEWLNSFTQKELALHLFQQPLLLAGLITASVAIGLLAGIYP
ncbi:MAG TPA: FtsX-like permease family protein, partial [Cyclobacteriaceae bacterium]|nr:FtsX-like permease family protein [Cyclobacteriaceae bacterium]